MTSAIDLASAYESPRQLLALAEGVDMSDEARLDELVDALLDRVQRRADQTPHGGTLAGGADVTIGVLRDRVKRLQEDFDRLVERDLTHDKSINELTLEMAKVRVALDALTAAKEASPPDLFRSGKLWAAVATAVATAIGAVFAWLSGRGG